MVDLFHQPSKQYAEKGDFYKILGNIEIEKKQISKFQEAWNRHWNGVQKFSEKKLQQLQKVLSYLYEKKSKNEQKLIAELPN